MEQCITDTHHWVVPLYDEYIKCKNADGREGFHEEV